MKHRRRKNPDNRFQATARRIQQKTGVRVEWAPANREYVVDGTPCGTAAGAMRLAKRKAKGD